MNNQTVFIEENVLEQAREICGYISDVEVRNKAVANVLALKLSEKFFTSQDLDVDSGIHNVYKLLESWDISDIYVNGAYIDVRICFDENDLYVPKRHFDRDLLPIAYMFIKIDSDLSSADCLGFILPENVDKKLQYNDYIKVNESDLVSYYDIESLLFGNDVLLPDDFKSQLFDYLDGVHSDSLAFSKLLILSKDARLELINASNAFKTFDYISIDSALNNSPDIEDDDSDINMPETDFLAEEITDSALELVEDSIELEDSLVSNELLIASGEDILFVDDESPESLIHEVEEENLLSSDEDVINDFIIDEDVEGIIEDKSQDDFIEVLSEVQEIAETDIINDEPLENTSTDELNFSEVEEVSNIITAQEYSTMTTPSIQDVEQENYDELEIEESVIEETDGSALTEEELDEAEDIVYDEEISESNQQIEDLFDNKLDEAELEQNVKLESKKKATLPFLLTLVVLGAIGYYGHNKFGWLQNSKILSQKQLPAKSLNIADKVNEEALEKAKEKEIPMPVESIENVEPLLQGNEGISVSIPAIEQNLDASILVSNLTVNWEVPAGFASNVSAKRYFTKLGKIVQLNLKTELLLLSKPPITDKISMELEFNSSNQRFGIKNLLSSSGEKTVDDLIEYTVRNVLSMTFNTNMNIFSSIQGNPILVIHF